MPSPYPGLRPFQEDEAHLLVVKRKSRICWRDSKIVGFSRWLGRVAVGNHRWCGQD